MADSLGDILGDSSGADFEDSVHESDKFNITNQTDFPATPKNTTSTASTSMTSAPDECLSFIKQHHLKWCGYSLLPSKHVKQYTGENLTVSSKAFFCIACREELSVKSLVITYHIKRNWKLKGRLILIQHRNYKNVMTWSTQRENPFQNTKGCTQ